MTIEFDMQFAPDTGHPVEVSSGVRRVTAPNAGPFTFHGTNSYLVGQDKLVVIDPGPDDDRHLAALLSAIGTAPVEAILVTHSHIDHTGLTKRLASATGAPVYAEGPHRSARPLLEGEANGLEAGADRRFQPDRRLAHGEVAAFAAGRFEAVATPGHTENHLAFALADAGILFSGDHVMAWSTTVVAPPDGSMVHYMASLDQLLERNDSLYFPGHGGSVTAPQPFVRALRSHRRMREASIRERVEAGARTIPEIVATIYRTTDPRLHGAAGLSVLAHLESLVARGLVECDGAPRIGSTYRPVSGQSSTASGPL